MTDGSMQRYAEPGLPERKTGETNGVSRIWALFGSMVFQARSLSLMRVRPHAGSIPAVTAPTVSNAPRAGVVCVA